MNGACLISYSQVLPGGLGIIRHEGYLTLYGFAAWCGIAVTIVLDGLPVIQGQSQNG